ncbi:MAG TPA: glycosyltransferase family 1 protein [Acidobacteriaceae bacterium]
MRIAVDHQVTSLQDAGGMSRYHYELARHLRGVHDLSIHLLLGGQSSVLPFCSLQGSGIGVATWRSRLRPGYPRYGMNALWTAAIAPLRGRYDVYHATYQRAEPAIRHRALVATHHDATQERFPHLFRNAAAIRARKARLYARANIVICVSESARYDLEELYGVGRERTRLVYHGVEPIPAAAAFTDGDPRPYLLYLGSRSAYKNFSALLSAFAAAPAAGAMRLVVAGGGAWTSSEQAAIAGSGLEGRVTLLPRVDDAVLAGLYRGAMLFVYPSLYEGFGLPPLEAMSAGCPVLVSRTSSLPEVCGDAAHYFDPALEGSLRAELDRLLADPALLRATVDAGRAQAGRYTWEAAATKTLAVYRDALECAPRR